LRKEINKEKETFKRSKVIWSLILSEMNKEIFSKAIVTLKYRDFKLIQVIRPCQSYPDLSFREMILLWDSFLQYQAHILTLHPGILNALFIVNVTTILKIFNHFLKQSLKIIFH
jgi:hypothetical protein